MMEHRYLHWAAGLGLSAVAACGPYRGSSAAAADSFETGWSDPSQAVPPASLGRREMAPYAGRPVADALRHLRPEWLRVTSVQLDVYERPSAVVYTDDVASGDVRSLETIPSAAVVEVRFLRLPEARIRYGPACRCPAGVILVRTRSAE